MLPTDTIDAASAEDEDREAHVPPGTVLLGRYSICGPIGEGGFADVYEAERLDDGNHVAVKLLHKLDGERRQRLVRQRFIREAKLVSQIHHPDVVEIFDFGVTEDGRLLIAMELLKGITLEDELEQHGAIEPARALRIMIRCLSGLQAAHALGVVHRDLKPANLFIDDASTEGERLRILDFGIAFVADDPANRLTRTGQINGTPQYLAPEYIQAQLVTQALDIYQMGLILAEMCTGIPVVNEDNPYKCLMAHASGQLNINPGLMRSPLGPVLAQATATNHAARFQDAASMQAALLPLIPQAHTIAEALAAYTHAKRARRRAGPSRHGGGKGPGHPLPVQISIQASGPPPAPRTTPDISVAPIRESDGIEMPRNRAWVTAVVILLIVLSICGAALVAFDVDLGRVGRVWSHTEVTETLDAELVRDVAADPRVTEVVVSVTPARAQIKRGTTVLSRGTATILFSGDQPKPIELTVSLRRYQTQAIAVTPSDAPIKQVKLRRNKRHRRRR